MSDVKSVGRSSIGESSVRNQEINIKNMATVDSNNNNNDPSKHVNDKV